MMKYGFVYKFDIIPEYPFYDGVTIIRDVLEKYDVHGFAIQKIEKDHDVWIVICFNTTRRKVEKVCTSLNGRRIRNLDSFTFEVLADFIM